MTSSYQLTHNNDSWLIESDSGYKLNNQDHKTYHKVWSNNFQEGILKQGYSVLLINDADQIFYNSLYGPLTVTLVDPDCYKLCEGKLKSVLSTVDFKNVVDSLGHSHKLTLLDMSFEEAKEDGCFKHKYNSICVSVKSSSDLSLEKIEQYFLLLEDFGCLFIQIENNLLTEEIKLNLDHYFSLLNTKIRTSTAHGNMQTFNSYIKISSLV